MADTEVDRLITRLDGDLTGLKNALSDGDREIDRFAETSGKSAKGAGRKIEQGVKKGTDAVKRDLDELGRTGGKKAEAAGKKTADGFKRGAKGLGGAIDGLKSRLLGLFAVGAIGAGIKKFFQLADTAKILAARLKLVTDSTGELIRAQRTVFNLAQENGRSLTSVADLYGKLTRSGKQLSKTQQDIATTTKAVLDAVKLSGSGAQASEAAIFQFNQAVASGVFRGEEFNSVMEQTPELAFAIADGLGVTAGEMRKMAAEGELTAERVINALNSQADALDKRARTIPLTLSQVMQKAANVVTRAVADFDAQAGASAGTARMLNATLKPLAVGLGIIGDTAIVTASAVRGAFNLIQNAAVAVTGAVRAPILGVVTLLQKLTGGIADIADRMAATAGKAAAAGVPGAAAMNRAALGVATSLRTVEQGAAGVAASLRSQFADAAASIEQNNADMAEAGSAAYEALGRGVARVTGEYDKLIDAQERAQMSADEAADKAAQAEREREAALKRSQMALTELGLEYRALTTGVDTETQKQIDALKSAGDVLVKHPETLRTAVKAMLRGVGSQKEANAVRSALQGLGDEAFRQSSAFRSAIRLIDKEWSGLRLDEPDSARFVAELQRDLSSLRAVVSVEQGDELARVLRLMDEDLRKRVDFEIATAGTPPILTDETVERLVRIKTEGAPPVLTDDEVERLIRLKTEGELPEIFDETVERLIRIRTEGEAPILTDEEVDRVINLRTVGAAPILTDDEVERLVRIKTEGLPPSFTDEERTMLARFQTEGLPPILTDQEAEVLVRVTQVGDGQPAALTDEEATRVIATREVQEDGEQSRSASMEIGADLSEGSRTKLAALEEQLAAEREIEVEAFVTKTTMLQELEVEGEEAELERKERLRQAEEDFQNALTDIDKRGAEAREKIVDAESKARKAAMSSMFNSLATLTDTNSRKLFEIGKGAAVANTVMGTIEGAASAYNKTSGAFPAPIGPILGAAHAAAVTLSGVAAVQKIKSTQFGKGASPAGAAGGGAAVGLSNNTVGGGQVPGSPGGGEGPQRNIQITLAGGDVFTSESIRTLVTRIGEEVGDGVRLGIND